MRRRLARAPRGSLAALAICALAVAALAAVPHRASAETLVVVDHVGDVYEGSLGGELIARPETGVSRAAFDGTGRLWLATRRGEEGCSLTSPDQPTSEISFDSVSFVPQARRGGYNGCGIATAPGAALLFDSDDGTAASSSIWRLDLASLQARVVHGGLTGVSSVDGRVAISQYRYYRGGRGAYTTLLLGGLERGEPIRAAVHQALRSERDRIPGWYSPSFAPDGRLAAVRYLKNGRSQLVVGGPGAWRAVWRPSRALGIRQTGWSQGGDLLVIAGTRADRSQLYFLPGGTPGTAQQLYPDVASFTLGPDRPPLPSTVE